MRTMTPAAARISHTLTQIAHTPLQREFSLFLHSHTRNDVHESKASKSGRESVRLGAA